jgi:arylsulfatase A-like enzyme
VLDNQTPLPPRLATYPQELQRAGYRTAYIGKFHTTMQGRAFLPLLSPPSNHPAPWRTEFLYEYFWERGYASTPTVRAAWRPPG